MKVATPANALLVSVPMSEPDPVAILITILPVNVLSTELSGRRASIVNEFKYELVTPSVGVLTNAI